MVAPEKRNARTARAEGAKIDQNRQFSRMANGLAGAARAEEVGSGIAQDALAMVGSAPSSASGFHTKRSKKGSFSDVDARYEDVLPRNKGWRRCASIGCRLGHE